MEPTERNNGLRIVLWISGALIVYAGTALLPLEILFTNTMGVHLDGTESSPHMRDAADQLKLKNCTRSGYLAAEATAANGALSVDARIERENPAAGRYTFVLRITKQP